MRRRNTTHSNCYVGSSRAGLKSDNVRKPALSRLADMQAAANLVKDLRAPIVPLAVARAEAIRIKGLARAVAGGRMSLADARACLRGAA